LRLGRYIKSGTPNPKLVNSILKTNKYKDPAL
jgi:hypothetical protein